MFNDSKIYILDCWTGKEQSEKTQSGKPEIKIFNPRSYTVLIMF